MKLLGIDHGLRRLGLATCDVSGLIARELAIIERKSKAEDFAQINQHIAQERMEAIVVGVPTNYEAHADQQSQAKSVRKWVAQLAEAVTIPIILWDEQLSSADARELAVTRSANPATRLTIWQPVSFCNRILMPCATVWPNRQAHEFTHQDDRVTAVYPDHPASGRNGSATPRLHADDASYD